MAARRPSRRLAVALGAAFVLSNVGMKSVAAAVVERPREAVHRALQVAQADGSRVFAIPAGPLPEAIEAFSRATGIAVSVDPAVTAGKKTDGVVGRKSPSDALAALLGGTGLRAHFVDAYTVRVDINVIANVSIAASGRDAYYSGDAANPKLGKALVDIPQSIAIVSQQTLKDQGTTSVRDALRNVSGISLAAGEGGSQGDSLTIRGFDAKNDFYVDGMRDYGNYYRDTFDLESVEVSQGASGAIFGRGSTGGTIDQISKQPSLRAADRASFVGGSAGMTRATGDFDVPLSGHSAFRLNVMGQHSGVAGRDVGSTNRWGIAPSVSFGIGTSSTLTVDYLHLTEHDVPDYGLPLLWGKAAPVDRSNAYGFKNADRFDDATDIVTASYAHDYGSSLEIRNQTRYASYDHAISVANGIVTAPPPVGTPLETIQVDRTIHARTGHETFIENQTTAIKHLSDASALVGGIEIGSETSYERTLKYAGLPSTSLLHPDPDQPMTFTTVTPTETDATATDLGAYLLYTGNLDKHWVASGGGRYDSFDAVVVDPIGHSTMPQTVTAFSGRAAVTWKPSASGSVYLSWGTSFNPAIDALTVKGAPTPPEGNAGYELGAKFDLAHGGLSLATALFEQTKTNAKQTDLSGVTENIGLVKVDGATISLVGRLTRRWQATAGVTLLNTLVVASANPGETGNPLANTPHASFTFFSTYQLTPRLQIGAGAVSASKRFTTDIANAAYGFVAYVPGYRRYDAMAKYDVSNKLALQLNGYNVTDASYIDLIHPDHLVPGAGRSFTLTADMKL